MQPPRLSFVVLTWNEGRNIEACLASLARQAVKDFEVIVVDAASADDTLARIHSVQATFPVPLTVHVAATRIPIGEARNLGVRLARARAIAFLSADAELDPDWTKHALEDLSGADMVFGRQVHEPHAWTLGAAVRGLRYNFPEASTGDALRFASNVACAYRKEILERFPFDAWANAAEDLLIARRAARAGYLAAYDPRLIVHHHDVATSAQEMHKNVREGQGWGIYRNELGLLPHVLGWGAALVVAGAAVILAPLYASVSPWLAALPLVALLWLPALRRAVQRHRAIPARHLLRGVAASPAFDLAFLFHYVRGLVSRPRASPSEEPTKVQA